MTTRLRAGSDAQCGALVLVGDVGSFRQLARLLRAGETAAMKVDELKGRSSIRPINDFYLARGDGYATIEVTGNAATLTGDAASCARLADEIDLFLEHNDLTEPGMHVHIDAASAGDLLAIGSRELILAGPVPDDEG